MAAQARSKDYVEEATWRKLLVPLGAIFGIVLVIVGIVVLKRLSDAIRDNDTIRAVIRGTASNQDGHTAGKSAAL